MIERIYSFLKKIIGETIDFTVEPQDKPEFGHYSTNVALRLSGKFKKAPVEVALELKERILKADKHNFFAKIEVASAGFINFWLSEKTLQSELKEILKKKDRYGATRTEKNIKIQLEFISANPTGPLTLANGRGGFLGDALAKVLILAGAKVEREYYVNNTGNQILILGKSLLSFGGLIPKEDNFYQGGYVKDWARGHRTKLKKYQSNPLSLGKLAAKDFLASIKKVAVRAGISFDRWTREEQDIHKKNFLAKAMAIFKKQGLVYEHEGATWLTTTKFGDDKDRVLITSDGFPTYFFADAGHYLETKKRGFQKKINILGPDHYGYVHRIQAAAKILGLKDSVVIITQAIRLMRDNKEVKMSKRSGNFVTFGELLDEVDVQAARFFFLEHSPEAHMDFNLNLAKERSLKNPVYYVQYAYVRARSILKKSKAGNKKPKIAELELLRGEAELDLIRELVKLPDVISATAKDYRINRLTRYGFMIAQGFHNFYERERVIVNDEKLFRARLSLVQATEIILGSVLYLLGISKPVKM